MQFSADDFQRSRPLREQSLIGGDWCDSVSGNRVPVTKPATGVVIGSVPVMSAEEVDRAIAAARAALLEAWFDLTMSMQRELGALMTAEQGKPLQEAEGEIAYTASLGALCHRPGRTGGL